MSKFLHFLFGANQNIDRTALWAGIAVLVAAVGLIIALVQLRGIKTVSRADFAKRFIDSFFTAETRTLFTLLMNSALECGVLDIEVKDAEPDRLPILRIRKEIVEQLRGIVPIEEGKTGYSAFEVDDLLLGFFDDMGWYEKKGLIDLTTLKQAFGYYICQSHENGEIRKYLADEDNAGKYADFHYIYAKVKEGC